MYHNDRFGGFAPFSYWRSHPSCSRRGTPCPGNSFIPSMSAGGHRPPLQLLEQELQRELDYAVSAVELSIIQEKQRGGVRIGRAQGVVTELLVRPLAQSPLPVIERVE